MTKREPVVFEFVDLGGVAKVEEHGATMRVRRPIPTVPDCWPAGTSAGAGAGAGAEAAAAAAQAMSRMASPARDQGFQDRRNNSPYVAEPDVSRPPWVNKQVMALRSEENSSMAIDSSLERVVTEGPSAAAWDRSAPTSPSYPTVRNPLNRLQDSALAQRARKAAFMNGSPRQAIRNLARTSALGDEAQPSTSHSAGLPVWPVPLYSRVKANNRFESGVPPKHPIQGVDMAAAHAVARQPETRDHPRTAQLTMFYSGMVNVFDDVPYEKAQAIMLLASTESAWSSPNYSFLGSCANSGRPFSTPGRMNQPISRAGTPAPQSTTPSAGPPLGAVTNLPNWPQVTTTVELPQARKASLARFLEKRKDRTRKGPYTHVNDEAAGNDKLRSRNSRENSPSHPNASSNPPRRALSPPTAGNRTKSDASGSEPNSPPQTPRQSMSEDTSHAMLARKQCENLNMDTMVVARSEKSSPSR